MWASRNKQEKEEKGKIGNSDLCEKKGSALSDDMLPIVDEEEEKKGMSTWDHFDHKSEEKERQKEE